MNKKFSDINDIVYCTKQNGLRQTLGSGSFGQVKLVSHKSDPHTKYAMKKIKNTNLTEMKIIFQEIQLHQNLNHPNIIKFVDYLKQNGEVLIFLEYAENGDLFGYINKNKLCEKELLRLFYQSCLAIQYLHSRNIMHRDLKPENILVDKNKNIKVCDFGWSAIYRDNEIRETVCGTLEYMAPEIFMKKRQTKKTDVWALGILLFELFHNRAPFRGMRADVILRAIRANKKQYNNSLNPFIKNLIELILNKNPSMRPSVDEILQSPLFDQFKEQKYTNTNKNYQKIVSINSTPQQQNQQSQQCSTKWIDSNFKQKINNKSNVKIKMNSNRKNSLTTQDSKNPKTYISQDIRQRPVSRRKIIIDHSVRDYSAQINSQRFIPTRNQSRNIISNKQYQKSFNSNGFDNYQKKQIKIQQKKKSPVLKVNLEKTFANLLKKFQIIQYILVYINQLLIKHQQINKSMLKFINSLIKMQNKSYARRDRLLEIEKQAKQIWEDQKMFEREIDHNKPKFLITFPYPYMNGKIHLGHAYSMSKVEFMTRYKILKGFNILFPQGYHCTGMPISAAAKKLTEEIEKYGLEKLKLLASKRQEFNKLKQQNQSDQDPKFDFDFSEYPFMTQYEILLNCQVNEQEIPKFQDSLYWLEYFPEKAQTDLKNFGVAIDHRRSFITTYKNPYYNSFIEWQFNVLKQKEAIKFGKRPSIYCPKDAQMCADHDRAEGENAVPQEYTLIKIKVTDSKSKNIFKTEENVYLMAATLRPETMYGQTNCFILPDGQYGIYKMGNNELWVCSAKSMRNMSYQYMTKEFGQVEKVGEIKGDQLIGLECKAPLSVYDKIYVWPMLNISMNKGTGVVTSVPSDAPDDYAVMKDLQKKKAFREKYGLTDEQVLNYKPVSIIDVPEYSDLSAVTAYEAFKIKSQNDKEKLVKAKEEVYLKGFYKGVMKVGDFKGKFVKEAKDLVKDQLIKTNQGCKYYEPDQQVISRSGDECVVSLCDQWYISYGQDQDREELKKYVASDQFEKFNHNLENAFLDALDWLKEWGCSRSFGLGSRLPWDKQYLIESLSDSTIYMAYYTIAHYLQKDLQGKEPGLLGIKAEDITDDDWNYIFLDKERNPNSKISEENLKILRSNFKYWYPLDLRCSGKDLIKNHLTMSLYNHKFVWGDKYLPRGIFCNGWVMVNGEKMSKSKGNFFTLEDFGNTYSNDASRIAFANAGDTLDNANIELQQADQGILKLYNLEQVFVELSQAYSKSRTDSPEELQFYDQVFENQIKQIIYKADQNYSKLVMREVVKEVFYNMNSIRDEYVIKCGNLGMKKDLIRLWMESQLLILYPITPHFCDIMWKTLFLVNIAEKDEKLPKLVSLASYPQITENDIDKIVLKKNDFVENLGKNLRTTYQKFQKKKKKQQISKIYFLCAEKFQDWQKKVMDFLMNKSNEKIDIVNDKSWMKELKNIFKDQKQIMKKAMAFASFKIKEYSTIGIEALNGQIMFEEKDLIQKNLNVICKEVIDTSKIEVVYTSEVNDDKYKNLKKSVDHALPENPIIIIDF